MVEGEREEGGRRVGGGREEGGRRVGGGRQEGGRVRGGREEGESREGGGMEEGDRRGGGREEGGGGSKAEGIKLLSKLGASCSKFSKFGVLSKQLLGKCSSFLSIAWICCFFWVFSGE